MSTESPSLTIPSTGEGAAVCDALRAAGYMERAMAPVIKSPGPTPGMDVPVVGRRVAADTPFNLLVRLFTLGRSVPAKRLGEVLGGGVVDQLRGAGLLTGRDSVLAVARLMPFENLYLVSDFAREVAGRIPRPDHVICVGAASVSLANHTIRRACESALDLGTGAGIQAILAARHCRRVVGVDINARALSFSAFNAWLNGIGNITFRQGSFFEPVKGEQFDLVVSNPPFVISPESRYVFRDSGLRGDEVSERVVRGTAEHLADGGYGVMLANWHHGSDEDWADAPRRWVAGLGCDAWILCSDTEPPLNYAARWLRSSGEHGEAEFEQALDKWMAYYERIRIGRISAGTVILRRVAGRAAWVRTDHVSVSIHSGPCGDQIERIFHAETLLQQAGDGRALLELPFAVCPETRLEHVLAAEGAQWAVQSSRLSLSRGLGFSGKMDGYATAILSRCDGKRPMREIVREVLGGAPADCDETWTSIHDVVKAMLRSGLIVAGAPVDPGSGR